LEYFRASLNSAIMDLEVNRTGSADSENGSSDSYVQISKEDAQGGDFIPSVEAEINREEDISPPYGDKDVSPSNGDKDDKV